MPGKLKAVAKKKAAGIRLRNIKHKDVHTQLQKTKDQPDEVGEPLKGSPGALRAIFSKANRTKRMLETEVGAIHDMNAQQKMKAAFFIVSKGVRNVEQEALCLDVWNKDHEKHVQEKEYHEKQRKLWQRANFKVVQGIRLKNMLPGQSLTEMSKQLEAMVHKAFPDDEASRISLMASLSEATESLRCVNTQLADLKSRQADALALLASIQEQCYSTQAISAASLMPWEQELRKRGISIVGEAKKTGAKILDDLRPPGSAEKEKSRPEQGVSRNESSATSSAADWVRQDSADDDDNGSASMGASASSWRRKLLATGDDKAIEDDVRQAAHQAMQKVTALKFQIRALLSVKHASKTAASGEGAEDETERAAEKTLTPGSRRGNKAREGEQNVVAAFEDLIDSGAAAELLGGDFFGEDILLGTGGAQDSSPQVVVNEVAPEEEEEIIEYSKFWKRWNEAEQAFDEDECPKLAHRSRFQYADKKSPLVAGLEDLNPRWRQVNVVARQEDQYREEHRGGGSEHPFLKAGIEHIMLERRGRGRKRILHTAKLPPVQPPLVPHTTPPSPRRSLALALAPIHGAADAAAGRGCGPSSEALFATAVIAGEEQSCAEEASAFYAEISLLAPCASGALRRLEPHPPAEALPQGSFRRSSHVASLRRVSGYRPPNMSGHTLHD